GQQPGRRRSGEGRRARRPQRPHRLRHAGAAARVQGGRQRQPRRRHAQLVHVELLPLHVERHHVRLRHGISAVDESAGVHEQGLARQHRRVPRGPPFVHHERVRVVADAEGAHRDPHRTAATGAVRVGAAMEPVEPHEPRRAASDDGGFALTWFAILLLVLIAMAGFGVDVWNWWYTSQRVQRAADAGALAGVTFMPANFNTPAGGPNAVSVATGVVTQNGFTQGGRTTVTVGPGDKANQLKVTVSETVDNNFTSLLGLKTTTVKKTAIAEFNAPIQMGSPVGHLGNDPENGATDKHWLNIGAPNVDKHTGDRYADYQNCSASYGCSGSINSEYLDGTYVFTVDVPPSAAGQDIDIQAYDPEYADGNTGGQPCGNQWLSGAQLTSLTATYPDSAVRYAGGATDWCPGDDDTNLGTPQATAWI